MCPAHCSCLVVGTENVLGALFVLGGGAERLVDDVTLSSLSLLVLLSFSVTGWSFAGRLKMNSEQEEYESVALVKQEVFVYRIPPLTTNRGHKAVDWNLDAPDWTGRMRLVAVGKKKLELRLEDKASGNLFATCPVDEYPGGAIEPVTDSSRYFVVRLKDPNGRTAFIGLGFSDRGDSFDLNVALQDHFRYLEKAEAVSHAESHPEPALDLGFKQGQTITINLGGKKPSGSPARQRPPAASGNAPVPFLPPPPSAGSSVQRSSRTTANQSPKPSSTEPKTADLLP